MPDDDTTPPHQHEPPPAPGPDREPHARGERDPLEQAIADEECRVRGLKRLRRILGGGDGETQDEDEAPR